MLVGKDPLIFNNITNREQTFWRVSTWQSCSSKPTFSVEFNLLLTKISFDLQWSCWHLYTIPSCSFIPSQMPGKIQTCRYPLYLPQLANFVSAPLAPSVSQIKSYNSLDLSMPQKRFITVPWLPIRVYRGAVWVTHRDSVATVYGSRRVIDTGVPPDRQIKSYKQKQSFNATHLVGNSYTESLHETRRDSCTSVSRHAACPGCHSSTCTSLYWTAINLVLWLS